MKVAYIAPEIPGLSSTFVYNEILELESIGFEVLPISIHEGMAAPPMPQLEALKRRALRGYGRGALRVAKDNLVQLLRRPIAYVGSLWWAACDSLCYAASPKVGVGIIYRFLVAASIARDLKRSGSEHVHAHFGHFPADLAMYASKMAGIPFSVTLHANDIFSNFWLLKQKVARSKFVAAISIFNIEHLTRLGCDSDKIHLVRCGVDTSRCVPDSKRSITQSPVCLGFLGRLVEKKGVDTLLLACALVKSNGTAFTLEIAGDGPLLSAAKQLCNELELDRQVTFLGNVDNDKVFPWLNTIDVFVLPCRQDSHGDMDGIPVALMEAILCGKAVISTKISGVPELIIDGTTGLLADSGCALSLSQKIEELLTSVDLAKSLSVAASNHLAKHFDGKENAEVLARLLSASSL